MVEIIVIIIGSLALLLWFRTQVGMQVNEKLYKIASREPGHSYWYTSPNAFPGNFYYPWNFHLWTTKQWYKKLKNDYAKKVGKK